MSELDLRGRTIPTRRRSNYVPTTKNVKLTFRPELSKTLSVWIYSPIYHPNMVSQNGDCTRFLLHFPDILLTFEDKCLLLLIRPGIRCLAAGIKWMVCSIERGGILRWNRSMQNLSTPHVGIHICELFIEYLRVYANVSSHSNIVVVGGISIPLNKIVINSELEWGIHKLMNETLSVWEFDVVPMWKEKRECQNNRRQPKRASLSPQLNGQRWKGGHI